MYTLILASFTWSVQQVIGQVFSFPFMTQAQNAWAMKTRKGKHENPWLAVWTKQTRLT